MLNFSINKSDTIGACASGLCLIHCLATPFLFLATVTTTCSQSCCSTAPVWYQWFDYFFLFISFFAVYYSTKTTTSSWVKYGLWISWIAFLLVLLNANYQWIYLSQNFKFLPSFSLIGLHLYNLRFCQCAANECCWYLRIEYLLKGEIDG